MTTKNLFLQKILFYKLLSSFIPLVMIFKYFSLGTIFVLFLIIVQIESIEENHNMQELTFIDMVKSQVLMIMLHSYAA